VFQPSLTFASADIEGNSVTDKYYTRLKYLRGTKTLAYSARAWGQREKVLQHWLQVDCFCKR